MALFKTAKRRRSRQGDEDRAIVTLDLLTGLCGYWTGTRREFDADERATGASRAETRGSFCVTFELNPERTHVISHNEGTRPGQRVQNFDVWGREASTGELVRTIFTNGARQTNAYDISQLDCDRRRSTWRLVMETVSWDEGRPCEIRYEISRERNHLHLRLSRRLISQGAGYRLVVQANLVKVN